MVRTNCKPSALREGTRDSKQHPGVIIEETLTWLYRTLKSDNT